jgi:hypothetical protein
MWAPATACTWLRDGPLVGSHAQAFNATVVTSVARMNAALPDAALNLWLLRRAVVRVIGTSACMRPIPDAAIWRANHPYGR